MMRPDDRSGELPLIAWGEAAHARRRRRRLLHLRGAAIACLIAAVAISAAIPPSPRLLWNASASAPIGLYLIQPDGPARPGNLVVVWVPASVRTLAAARGYVPRTVPLVKHVGAVPGDTVCATGSVITIDGRVAADRRLRDGAARPMPWWHGCRTLLRSEIFLLSGDVASSFDGRYFGVSPAADVIGAARPLWLR